MDDSRYPGPDDTRPTIILGSDFPTKYVVLHNSLPFTREEIVEFYVSKPFVFVTDFDKTPVESQVSPVWSWTNLLSKTILPQSSTTKYRVIFKARVPPLGLAVYIINSASSVEDSMFVLLYNLNVFLSAIFMFFFFVITAQRHSLR